MNITIPAGTTLEQFGDAFLPLMEWLRANGVEPAHVSGGHPLEIGSKALVFVTTNGNTFDVPVPVPMPDDLASYLAARFGGVWQNGESVPPLDSDLDSAPLDDMAQLVKELADSRDAEKQAKERAAEARDAILGRLRAAGREFGTVNGERVVQAKLVTSNKFQTVEFRKAHPELAAEYTKPSESTRLEIL